MKGGSERKREVLGSEGGSDSVQKRSGNIVSKRVTRISGVEGVNMLINE